MADRIIIRGEQQRTHAINRLTALKLDPDAPMEVVIKPYKRSRSLEQNDLYWRWLSLMGDDLGYTKDEMHEEMMRQHLTPLSINTPAGIVEVYSTKKLKVKEMSEYLNKINITAGQMGIALPLPIERDMR
jgi:hypothetical protein